MSPRPYVNFSEVKAKITIPDVLGKLDLLDQFTEKGGVFTGVCPLPLHKHSSHPNAEQFRINQKDGVWLWHCFGDCKKGGDVIELVKALNNLSDAHVRFWFADNFGDWLTLGQPDRKGQSSSETQPATAEAKPAEPLKPLRFYLDLDADCQYLRDRGVESKTVEGYGLGLCTKGVLDGYVAIPIHRWPKESRHENPVGYIGCWPGDDWNDTDRPRYKLPTGFEVSRVVYGLEQALNPFYPSEPLIVVEGVFKVYHLTQHGFPSAVSTFTSSLSDEQADILVATGRPIVLMFDGDEAGQAAMRTAAANLITRAFVRVVKLGAGVEPDQLSGEELGEVLAFFAQWDG